MWIEYLITQIEFANRMEQSFQDLELVWKLRFIIIPIYVEISGLDLHWECVCDWTVLGLRYKNIPWKTCSWIRSRFVCDSHYSSTHETYVCILFQQWYIIMFNDEIVAIVSIILTWRSLVRWEKLLRVCAMRRNWVPWCR